MMNAEMFAHCKHLRSQKRKREKKTKKCECDTGRKSLLGRVSECVLYLLVCLPEAKICLSETLSLKAVCERLKERERVK